MIDYHVQQGRWQNPRAILHMILDTGITMINRK